MEFGTKTLESRPLEPLTTASTAAANKIFLMMNQVSLKQDITLNIKQTIPIIFTSWW